MSITVDELFDGRSEVAHSSAEVPYAVRGAVDEEEVRDAVEENTPTTYDGMDRSEIEISERINETTWRVIVRYLAPTASPDESEFEFSFDISGGTQHITQSIKTIKKYGPMACDLGGAIGFDGETIKGVDIVVPTYSFTETHCLSSGVVTFDYKRTLFRAVGRTNSTSWRGFAEGEVLFTGVSGSQRGIGENWSVTFRFAAQPNEDDITIGTIKNIEKKGWEYLWVRYAPDVDSDKKVLIKRPIAVYVEQVYKATNFSALGIGS